MSEKPIDKLLDVTELVKRISDKKRRATASAQAGQQARKAIREKQQFVPKPITPVRSVDASF